MYNEPPIVRPPLAPPVQESPYSSPIVVNTTKPTLYVKKKSSDAWAWKTIVIALLLSPVIWYGIATIIVARDFAEIAKNLSYPGISNEMLTASIENYYDSIGGSAKAFGQAFTITLFIEMLICIPLGIFYVVRR